jgi:uncharacterized membrane protein YcaP (DUF421 family)
MDIDWKSVFMPSIPLIEIVLRGTAMYIAVFILLRITARRQVGSLSMTDLLLITFIADASQNAMAGEYKSIPDGIVLVATIIFWSYALDWLSFHSPRLRRLIEPPPLPLIKNGRLLRRNMRRELITDVDLKAQLREQGISDIANVKEAYVEADGNISVVGRQEEQHGKPEKRGST